MTRGGLSPASAFGFAHSAAVDRAGPVCGEQSSEQVRSRPEPVESWTLTAEQIERWLKSARIGESLVYARGPNLIDGAAAALVRRLGAEGVLHPFPRRINDRCSDYIARLLRVRVVTQRAPVCDPAMMAVLVELQAAAEDQRRCPSDAEIGAATALTADQVKWQLKKLEDARFIARRHVRAAGQPKFRIVKVVATGAETAGPGETA